MLRQRVQLLLLVIAMVTWTMVKEGTRIPTDCTCTRLCDLNPIRKFNARRADTLGTLLSDEETYGYV